MKQSLFLVPLAALALASCSKDETTGTNIGHAIDFRSAMQTRATETTIENLNSFAVTAIDEQGKNYFTDVEFTKSENVFVSAPAYYWPSDGSSLEFFAYSPAKETLGGTLTITGTDKTLADFVPAAEISAQQDFITAKATGGNANESTGVELTFDHQLAQIEVKAKSAHDGYVFKVRGVRIGKPVSKGTFNFADSNWALAGDKSNYEVTYTTDKVLDDTAVSIMGDGNGNAMLIPQQLTGWDSASDKTNEKGGAYLAVNVQIETVAGARVYPAVGEYDWVAMPISTNWEAGNKYIYTLDFSNGAGVVDPEKPTPVDPEDPFEPGDEVLGGAIKFTVSVQPWTDTPENVEM